MRDSVILCTRCHRPASVTSRHVEGLTVEIRVVCSCCGAVYVKRGEMR